MQKVENAKIQSLTPCFVFSYDRVQLIATLSTILRVEFRDGRWPQFLPGVLAMVQSQDLRTIYAGLAALQELAKIYQ